MSGYTPVFRTVFEGSLCGQYPDTAAWLFLLALADKSGNVDKTPQYIAAVTGMPVDDLVVCIERFMQPDPASRSEAEEGRRLVPIDPCRPWGWRIVNHSKYREKARLQAREAVRVECGDNRSRMESRKSETPADPRRPPPTPADPPSDANTNTAERARKRASRRCPEDFEPDREYAQREVPDIDVDREFEGFRDYEFVKPRSDWPAAWRRWVRTCRDTGRYARRAVTRLGNGGDWT